MLVAPIRIIDPGEVVMQHYLLERINFVVGRDRGINGCTVGERTRDHSWVPTLSTTPTSH